MLSVSKRFSLHKHVLIEIRYIVTGRKSGSFPQLLPHMEKGQIMDKVSVLSGSLVDLLTVPHNLTSTVASGRSFISFLHISVQYPRYLIQFARGA